MTDRINKAGDGRGVHPNSLAALGRPWTSEEAKAAQLKGAKKRSENAAARKAIKESLSQWKMMKEEILTENLSAMDTLKLLLAKALHDEDYDTAADLASKLAEYEQPKLARQEVKVEDVGAEEMSDEELNAKLRAMLDEQK